MLSNIMSSASRAPRKEVAEGDREANPMAIPVLAEPGDVSGGGGCFSANPI